MYGTLIQRGRKRHRITFRDNIDQIDLILMQNTILSTPEQLRLPFNSRELSREKLRDLSKEKLKEP